MNGNKANLRARAAPITAASDGGAAKAMLTPAMRWAKRGCSSCNALAAAHCLYRFTLAAISETAPATHRLRDPLARLVSQQTTREGQEHCARYALALASHDYPAALDACRQLIERESGERPSC